MVLITAGNLIQKKGFDTVLKALPAIISKHPNLLYFIVGDGREKAALEQMVDKLRMNSNVCFCALSQKKFASISQCQQFTFKYQGIIKCKIVMLM